LKLCLKPTLCVTSVDIPCGLAPKPFRYDRFLGPENTLK
jgi:hypothetical protein